VAWPLSKLEHRIRRLNQLTGMSGWKRQQSHTFGQQLLPLIQARSHFVSWLDFRTNKAEVWRRWGREMPTTTASAMQLSVWDFRLLQLQLATHLVANRGFQPGRGSSTSGASSAAEFITRLHISTAITAIMWLSEGGWHIARGTCQSRRV